MPFRPIWCRPTLADVGCGQIPNANPIRRTYTRFKKHLPLLRMLFFIFGVILPGWIWPVFALSAQAGVGDCQIPNAGKYLHTRLRTRCRRGGGFAPGRVLILAYLGPTDVGGGWRLGKSKYPPQNRRGRERQSALGKHLVVGTKVVFLGAV